MEFSSQLEQSAMDFGIDQYGSGLIFDVAEEEEEERGKKKQNDKNEEQEKQQQWKNIAVEDEYGILKLRSSLDFVQMLVRSSEREINTLMCIAMDLINRESHRSRIPSGVIDEIMNKRCAQFTEFAQLFEQFKQHVDDMEKRKVADSYGSEMLCKDVKRTARNIYIDIRNIRICIVFCLVAECDAMQRLVRLGKFVSLHNFHCDLRYHPIPKASFDEYLHVTKALRTAFLNAQTSAKNFIKSLCASTPCGVHSWIETVVKPGRIIEAQRLAQDIERDLQAKILLESEETEEEDSDDIEAFGAREWD
jgi:hypothetical protein